MSERLKIIQPKKKFEINKKHFEILGISDETLLGAIEPIEQGGLIVESKDNLAKVVEPPLLEACEILFDKKIETIMSSANKKDLGNKPHIIILYDTLTPQNKKISESMGIVSDYMGKKYLKVEIPFLITEQTTVGQIRKAAKELVSKFVQQ